VGRGDEAGLGQFEDEIGAELIEAAYQANHSRGERVGGRLMPARA
jgi:hypothetical protein